MANTNAEKLLPASWLEMVTNFIARKEQNSRALPVVPCHVSVRPPLVFPLFAICLQRCVSWGKVPIMFGFAVFRFVRISATQVWVELLSGVSTRNWNPQSSRDMNVGRKSWLLAYGMVGSYVFCLVWLECLRMLRCSCQEGSRCETVLLVERRRRCMSTSASVNRLCNVTGVGSLPFAIVPRGVCAPSVTMPGGIHIDANTSTEQFDIRNSRHAVCIMRLSFRNKSDVPDRSVTEFLHA